MMLSWVGDIQRIAAGVDYDYVEAEVSRPQLQGAQAEPEANRVGVYLNDTLTLGPFAITPSARFDHTGTGPNLFSPSLGVTYAVTDNSVLRGYAARGYSIISINRDDSTEKVWTAQLGFETADIPYLWLKGTIFHNDTWNIAVPLETPEGVVLSFQREVKTGYELEIKTTPVFDTSLSLAYTFIDAQNETTDSELQGVGRHTLKVGAKYENPKYLRAFLFGNYTDWNGSGGPYDGRYSAMVWDLHLGKEFQLTPNTSVEVFSSVRNLFNGAQDLFPYKYPRRWAEVGVRCAF
jgi:vitamin B12 transporter